jgi:hypothetical protein
VAESQLLSSQASNARSAGQINAFGSLVGGASNVSDKWQTYMWRAGTNGGAGNGLIPLSAAQDPSLGGAYPAGGLT